METTSQVVDYEDWWERKGCGYLKKFTSTITSKELDVSYLLPITGLCNNL